MLKSICLGRVCYEVNLPVDKLPEEGSTNEFFEKKGGIGGSIGTVAMCLSKWGINTSVACVLGNDVNGTRIRKELDKAHIDTRYIEPSYDNDTTISVIQINKTTRRQTILNLSDKYISLKKCDFDFTPDIICTDGYDAVQAKNLLERFPSCPSVLDASIATTSVMDLLRKAKYAICTKEFAEIASHERIDLLNMETLVRAYQALKKKYLKTEFVITLGDRGALYCINNQIKISPSLKVEAIDTHTCNAVFRAAFAHTIANGGDIEKAVKMGCIAAGLSSRTIGSSESIPTLEEIRKIYEQNYQ